MLRARTLASAAALASVVAVLSATAFSEAQGETPGCSRGCDVKLGTWKGQNDQGKEVVLHVAVGKVGHETVHYIDHFKTQWVATCGSTKSNVYFDVKSFGHINGIRGHIYHGERYMEVLFSHESHHAGFARYKNPSCTSITHFKLHHVAH